MLVKIIVFVTAWMTEKSFTRCMVNHTNTYLRYIVMAICLIKLTTSHAWCHCCWGNGVIQVEDLKLRCDPHAMAEGQMKGWKVEDLDVFLLYAMEKSTWYAKMIRLYRIKVHDGKYHYSYLSCLKQFDRNSRCLWIVFWFGRGFCQWCISFKASQEFKKFVEYGCNPIRCEKHGVKQLGWKQRKRNGDVLISVAILDL